MEIYFSNKTPVIWDLGLLTAGGKISSHPIYPRKDLMTLKIGGARVMKISPRIDFLFTQVISIKPYSRYILLENFSIKEFPPRPNSRSSFQCS